MTVTVEDRYKQALNQLQFASNIRFKILAAWGAVYIAMGATFVWIQANDTLKQLSWVVPLFTIALTVLFWAFDERNGSAIGAAKEVGIAIEEDVDNDIPEKQRYFYKLNQHTGMRHGEAIGIFTIVIVLLLIIATIYLYCNNV